MKPNDSLELVEMKNREMTKLKITNAGLVVLTVLMLVVVLFVALASRIAPPSLNANVDVLKDVTPLVVPAEIVSGEPFTYTATGFKNKFEAQNGVQESPTAFVRLQYTCELADGVTNTFPFLEFYSNVKSGHYEVKRETALPVTPRVKSADRCFMESYAEYKLFVTNKSGETNEINFTEKNRSNYFRLIVKPVETSDTTNVTNVTNSTVSRTTNTGTTSTSTGNTNVAQSIPAPQSNTTPANPTQTTTAPPEPPRQGLIPSILNGLLGL